MCNVHENSPDGWATTRQCNEKKMTCCAHAQPKIRQTFYGNGVGNKKGKFFFNVARRVMNESSYHFHCVQPIRTKSCRELPLE